MSNKTPKEVQEELQQIIQSLSNTSGSFEEYANQVKKIIAILKKQKSNESYNTQLKVHYDDQIKDKQKEISQLSLKNAGLEDTISKITSDNEKQKQIIQSQNNQVCEIEMKDLTGTKNKDLLSNIIQKYEEHETKNKKNKSQSKFTLDCTKNKTDYLEISDKVVSKKIKKYTDINNAIRESCWNTKGGNPQKTRKRYNNKRSKYTLKKLYQTRL
jgi:chromosome segregation ATPase